MYLSFSGGVVALGVFFVAAPQDWYGPSWSFFRQIPHNGFGMGLCCIGLGSLQILAVLLNAKPTVMAVLLYLAGFVFFTAGTMLGAEGLLGHQGLIPAPLLLFIAVHKYALGANIMAGRK
jgi:hypothetical protein